MAQLTAGSQKLASGAGALKSGASTLSSGIGQLATGAASLKDGTGKLASGGKALKAGTNKLYDGSRELSAGMKKFDKEGIQKLSDTINGGIQDVLNRLKAVEDADKAYKAFDGQTDDMDGSVKFVIETAGIE